MSNPLQAPRTQLIANAYPDGTFTVPGGMTLLEWCESVKKSWGLKEVLEKLVRRKEGMTVAPSVLMKPAVNAGLVFNEGAAKRLMAITNDGAVTFRLRSLLATNMRNYMIGFMADGPVQTLEDNVVRHSTNRLASKQECVERTTTHFMVAGGTQWAMGRLQKALPEATVHRLRPVTLSEAERAYEHCGFYHGNALWQSLRTNPFDMDAYGALWPLVAGSQGHSVTIVKAASLGHPYYAKATDDAALNKCLRLTQYMQVHWSGHAGQSYREALIKSPSMVTFVGKTKTDIYSSEKIMQQMMRYYVVCPGHLKFYLAQATQPFAKAKTSLLDIANRFGYLWTNNSGNPYMGLPRTMVEDPEGDGFTWAPECGARKFLLNFHSAQKMGLTGNAPRLLVNALDAQLTDCGMAYMHCGDDTWIVIMQQAPSDARRKQMMFMNLDMSNFDLTQRREVCDKIHEVLYKGLAEIDVDRAEVMREIWRKKLINLHASACVFMENGSFSGIPLQSEKNDMLCEVMCMRIKEAVATRYERRVLNGLPAYCGLTFDALDVIVREVGLGLGLEARIDNKEIIAIPDEEKTQRDWFEEQNNGNYFYAPIFRAFTENLVRWKFLGYEFFGTENMQMGYRTFMMNAPNQNPRQVLRPWPVEGSKGIAVVAQLPRFLTNILYPNVMWMKGRKEFEAYNAVRLIGAVIGLGNAGVLQDQGMPSEAIEHLLEVLWGAVEQHDGGDTRTREMRLRSLVTMLQENIMMNEAVDEFNPTPLFGGLEAETIGNRKLRTMQAIFAVWDPLRRTVMPVPRDIATAGAVPSSEVVDMGMPDLTSQIPAGYQLILDNQLVEGLAGIAARTLVDQSFGQAWADEMEVENLLEGVRPLAPPTVGDRLRPATEANFGRPPPNVGITNPMSATGLPGGGRQVAAGGGGGDGERSRTQKKRDQRRRKRARENAGAHAVEAAGEHFRNLRLEEQEALDAEAAYRRQARD